MYYGDVGGVPSGAKPVEFKVYQQEGRLIYKAENGLTVSIFSKDKGVPVDAQQKFSAFQKEDGTIVFSGLNNAVVTGSQGKDQLLFKDSNNNCIDIANDNRAGDNVMIADDRSKGNIIRGNVHDMTKDHSALYQSTRLHESEFTYVQDEQEKRNW